ncbi:MAG: anthranilate 1,2-dioxygenase ferredoxin component [Actinomycetota bacterium]|nr:anthranilate 1,2-dioxygenase ferredoxin component [Actinomycetota bacterium]
MTEPLTSTGHRVARLEDLPIGEGRAFAVDGRQIAVFRTRDGGLYAVSATCPHAGGPIADGQADNAVVVCPLHAHVYELATGCSRTGQPALAVHPADVDQDGWVVVHVST